MADARRRHEVEHAFENAAPRPQHRDEAELLAGERGRAHGGDGSLDVDHLCRQVAHDLVAEEQADLAQEPPKLPGRRLRAPHQRQLVLDQRMIDHGHVAHALKSKTFAH